MYLRRDDLHNIGALILARGIPMDEGERRELRKAVEEWLRESDAASTQWLPKHKKEAVSFLIPQLGSMLVLLERPVEVE